MIKILLFFLLLVVVSYYLSSIFIFFPLDFINNLESASGYVAVAVGVLLTIWLMGD